MKEDNKFKSDSPTIGSWMIAASCCCAILLALAFLNSGSKSLYNTISYNKIKTKIEKLKDPSKVLEDKHFLALSKSKLKEINKTVALYNSIRDDYYSTSQIIIKDSDYTSRPQAAELNSYINSLSKLATSSANKEEKNKIKQKALALALSMFEKEVLPKTDKLGNKIYNLFT